MSEQQDIWARQWQQLLTQSHGEDVQADKGFKSGLLAELKQKTAENRAADRAESSETTVTEKAGTDENWSTLLQHAYVPCRPSTRFKSALLAEMAARQTESAPVPEQATETILQQAEPATPRREFQTRLLDNLKERQRTTTVLRKSSRRKTLFMSFASSMAAAAAVLFVVWVMPTDTAVTAPAQPSMMATGGGAVFSTPIRMVPNETMFASFTDSGDSRTTTAIPNGLALASLDDYDVNSVFTASGLPTSMRGIGMEINHGDGWKPMDETTIAQLAPGIALRPLATSETAGIGFGNGSTVHMRPDSEILTTDRGIAVRQGTLTVNVPANSDSRFYMHFPERDVAVEPGTMLAVTVPSPDAYASGGAPAPVIKVLDGGMAVAKGRNGNGILLANQVYQLDNYVTPDLPGRPLCATEFEELEKTFMQPVGPESYSPAQMVSSTRTTAYRPSISPAGFSKKGTRWIANNYNDQATIKIPYLSDAFFAFANNRRDLAVPLSLGSNVILDGGDGHFYEIHK